MTARRIAEQAHLGGRWLVEQQDPDGRWRGVEDPKVDAYYKAIWALMEIGCPAAAQRTATCVKQRLLTPEGDFLPREHPAQTSVHYLYANAYIIIGSTVAGRPDVVLPATEFVLTQQDPIYGGFYSRLTGAGARDACDTMSIGAAGLACLATGHVGAARRAADCLARIVELQPDGDSRFFTTIASDGQLLTHATDPHDVFVQIIDGKKLKQCWYAMGLPFAFLVRLADALDDTRYRDLSRWFFEFQRRSVDAWDCSSSGKAGWGCAMLYRSTGETAYRDIALHIAERIASRQRPAGDWSWSSGRRHGKPPAPTNADLDLTAEYTLWLSLISTNILARDGSRLADIRGARLTPRRLWRWGW